MTTPYERSVGESSGEVVVTVSGEIDWSNASAALVAPGWAPPCGCASRPGRRFPCCLRSRRWGA